MFFEIFALGRKSVDTIDLVFREIVPGRESEGASDTNAMATARRLSLVRSGLRPAGPIADAQRPAADTLCAASVPATDWSAFRTCRHNARSRAGSDGDPAHEGAGSEATLWCKQPRPALRAA